MPDYVQVPLVPVRNLPEHTGSLDSDIQFVGIKGNQETVRISWPNLVSQFVTTSPVPESSNTSGEDGGIAFGECLYTYYNGQWGKIPRYVENWDDLDSNSRFLLINKVMSLTEEEREILRQNVGVGPATKDTYGTLKLSTVLTLDENGQATIPLAGATLPGILCVGGGDNMPKDTPPERVAASVEYVDDRVQDLIDNPSELNPATAEILGGIRSSSSVQVDSQGIATVPRANPATGSAAANYGITQVAPDTPDKVNNEVHKLHVTTLALVQALIKSGIADNPIRTATTEQTGAVMVPLSSVIVLNTTTGAIDVRTASINNKGAVTLVNSLTSAAAGQAGYVPTAKAIIDYLKDNPSAVSIPAATSTKVGGLKLSDTLFIDGNGKGYVPDANSTRKGVAKIAPRKAVGGSAADDTAASTAYVQEYVNTQSVTIPTATEAKLGGVYLVTSYPTASIPGGTTVPTFDCMQQYIEATAQTFNGGIVSGNTTFTGGLAVSSVGEAGTAVVNRAYVQQLEARIKKLEDAASSS